MVFILQESANQTIDLPATYQSATVQVVLQKRTTDVIVHRKRKPFTQCLSVLQVSFKVLLKVLKLFGRAPGGLPVELPPSGLLSPKSTGALMLPLGD